jgi:hypothetical protein
MTAEILTGVIVGVVVAVIGTIATHVLTMRLEKKRWEHERALRMREVRQQAYVVFFSLARDAMAKARIEEWLPEHPQRPEEQTGERTAVQNLRDAHATVELLGETRAIEEAARALYDLGKKFLEGQRPSETDEKKYKRARKAFLESARTELGIHPRAWRNLHSPRS